MVSWDKRFMSVIQRENKDKERKYYFIEFKFKKKLNLSWKK